MCKWEFKLVFCAELKKLMSCVKIRPNVFLLFANQREEAREVELGTCKTYTELDRIEPGRFLN